MRTLAGNGTKAVDDYVGGRKGRQQPLNSPWDLALDAEVGWPEDGVSLLPYSSLCGAWC